MVGLEVVEAVLYLDDLDDSGAWVHLIVGSASERAGPRRCSGGRGLRGGAVGVAAVGVDGRLSEHWWRYVGGVRLSGASGGDAMLKIDLVGEPTHSEGNSTENWLKPPTREKIFTES